MDAHKQDFNLKFTSDHLQPINGRAIEYQLYSHFKNHIRSFTSYQQEKQHDNDEQCSHSKFTSTAYSLVMEEQQDGWILAVYSFGIHFKPHTCCKWKRNRIDIYQHSILVSNIWQTTYCLLIEEQQDGYSLAGLSYKFTSDPLHPINQKRAGDFLSRIFVLTSYQITYILSMEEQQQNECLSAEITFQIYIRPLTNY